MRKFKIVELGAIAAETESNTTGPLCDNGVTPPNCGTDNVKRTNNQFV